MYNHTDLHFWNSILLSSFHVEVEISHDLIILKLYFWHYQEGKIFDSSHCIYFESSKLMNFRSVHTCLYMLAYAYI